MNKIRATVLVGSIGLMTACGSSSLSRATDKAGVTEAATSTAAPSSTVVPTTAPSTTVPATTSAPDTTVVVTVAETTVAPAVSGTLAPVDPPTAAPPPPPPAATTTKATTTTTTTTTTTSPAPTSPSGPVFTAFSLKADNCPVAPAPGIPFTRAPSTPMVTVSWKITGPYDMVYDAIDNVRGPYNQGLPSSGSDQFTRDCTPGAKHTYYVVAVSNGKRTFKSQAIVTK
jgi:hypothetical protein